MKKYIISILSILIVSANPVFAAEASAGCSFPHHVEITGPIGTHIMTVELLDDHVPGEASISNVTKNSFDLNESYQACIYIPLLVHLKVGTDEKHWNDIVLEDGNNKPINLKSDYSNNYFQHGVINDSNKKNIMINFMQY